MPKHLVPACLAALLCVGAPCGAADEAFEVVRDQVYAERGADSLAADVYRPTGDGPFPGVLVVHGGAWMSGTRTQLGTVAKRLAASGYTAVAISYRLAPKHVFPAQYEDCQSAVRWMRSDAVRLKIDPARIGGFGYSAGGHLVTLLGMTEQLAVADEAPVDIERADNEQAIEEKADAAGPSTRLQAVVAGGAPCDFRLLPENNRALAYWLGGTRGEKPDLYRLASPTCFVTKDDPPTFFFHGQKDRLVPILSPLAMQLLLKAAGVEASVYVVPDAGHIEAAMNGEAIAATIKFFDAHLKPAQPTP